MLSFYLYFKIYLHTLYVCLFRNSKHVNQSCKHIFKCQYIYFIEKNTNQHNFDNHIYRGGIFRGQKPVKCS